MRLVRDGGRMVIAGLAGLMGAAALAVGPWCGVAAAQEREPQWTADTFCFPGVDRGISTLPDVVWDACIFDDGTGPALYITGDFGLVGCAKATNIARWDGRRWSALEGPDGEGISNGRSGEGGRTLAVFDDGTGPALYVGGVFLYAGGHRASNIARWDGTTWSALEGPNGEGLDREHPTIPVRDMVVFDDGDGPALYVCGTFTRAGGRPATRVAKWDGRDWSPLAGPMGEGISGVGDRVRGLAVFDDGGGPDLYACGIFDTAGGRPINRVARWDGTDWSDVGGWEGDGQALTMKVYDDGSGEKLYMGGAFDVRGEFVDLVRWTGSAWEDMGVPTDGEIACLEVVDDGGVRPALYLGGSFDRLQGRSFEGLARYDGLGWSDLDGGIEPGLGGTVRTLLALNGAPSEGVFVGGHFHEASGKQLHSIALWDYQEHRAFGTAPSEITWAMAAFDDGSGESLFLGGGFLSAGDVPVRHVARFDGRDFSAVGDGLPNIVRDMAVYDDGSGPALYALSRSLHRLEPGGLWPQMVYASEWASLAVHDDGTGSRLFMGGRFQRLIFPGGTFEDLGPLVAWNGDSWSGIDYPYPDGPSKIVSVRVNDRTDLYAWGSFREAGGDHRYYMVRWDGTSWEHVIGPGDRGGFFSIVGFDDGAGWALYGAGDFRGVLGPGASQVARWDGENWTDIGQELRGRVDDLQVHDDGSGPALYACGAFTGDQTTITNIARWDGASWTALAGDAGEGVDDTARIMGSVRHRDGPALYVGGDFRMAGGIGSGGLAKWAIEPNHCPPDLDGDGELTIFDFLAFQNAFDAGDPVADFDGDGELTLFDFLAFQNEFDAGCA